MKRAAVIIIIAVVIIIAGLVVLILSRNQPQSVETKLVVWSPFDEAEIYQEISADFLQKNPGVTLELKKISAKDAKDYEAKVVNAIADGDGPDIWLARFDWLPKHLAKSQPYPSVGNTDPIATFSQVITPAIIGLNVFDGQLYGLPFSADSLAFIYNRDFYLKARRELDEAAQAALEAPAKSWDELKTQMALISQRQGTNLNRSAIALGTAENTFAAVDVLSAFLAQAGARIVSEDGQSIVFNLSGLDPADPSRFPSTEALDFYTSFARSSSDHYSWNTGLGDPIEAFLAGRTGGLIGYHSTLQEILKKKPSFEIAVSPLPQRLPEGARVDFAAGWTHLVNRDSANQALAWRYLGALANSSLIDRYARATGKISPVDSQLKVSARRYEASEAEELFAAQLSSAKNLFKPEWQTVDEVFQDAIKQVVNSGISPQNAIDSAALRLKELIALRAND